MEGGSCSTLISRVEAAAGLSARGGHSASSK
jgi:hypothetical protein